MSALPREATVAVFGAGAMGSGIAQVAAQAGHRVLLFDARINAANDARRKLADTFATLASRGKLEEDEARAAAARVQPVHAIGDVVSAKLVIEAIVEDLEAKRELFRELEVVVSPDAILATNTSSLSITTLAAGMQHPRRIAGMHFFNPAPVLPLVEIVSGLGTDPAIAQTLYDTAAAWNKSPVHATSTPGFIVNRCARPFYGEALRLIAERASDFATIDAIMRDAGGFRMGPFELMDLIGLDVNFAVTRSIWEAYFQDPRFTPSLYQQELVAAGMLGRKSGRGFFDYAQNAVKPEPQIEKNRLAPARVTAFGDLGPASELVDRLAGLGMTIERRDVQPPLPPNVIATGGALLALTDGRTATRRAVESGARDLVVFDLALDYHSAKRIAIARAESCGDAAYDSAVGALQAAGLQVSRVDDVAGLVVMRTVAMLANEAADAVQQGIATANDIDIAMKKGVNYPRGPLEWADVVGCARIRDVLANLLAHYGDPRYRIAPFLTRQCARDGGKLAGSP
ncbi:MAG TPA: 3-hydroxyacyl-CoA dehydrogenase PaaH [Casimicrobiaceae bacterium]|nr:3-hydroxyacyl-CoA dehydrogenase PaaH [Casimicrobiaceae bacterium]